MTDAALANRASPPRLLGQVRGKFGSSTITREPNTLIPSGLNPLSVFMTSATTTIVTAGVGHKDGIYSAVLVSD
jgi:hypothetical protein